MKRLHKIIPPIFPVSIIGTINEFQTYTFMLVYNSIQGAQIPLVKRSKANYVGGMVLAAAEALEEAEETLAGQFRKESRRFPIKPEHCRIENLDRGIYREGPREYMWI